MSKNFDWINNSISKKNQTNLVVINCLERIKLSKIIIYYYLIFSGINKYEVEIY